ncbi:hypothetical protein DERF_003880 [Dermatophagoides farinae]|uniref:Uncharacterized protein n=1 Tax=Dermatophagoides farinae TaxID=6954 RepID=A0A922IEI5_DERFA|nr:hypothetical protein DERF_003880 [Dermatophagoides farinae]
MITMSKENGRNMNRCRNSRDDSDRLMAQKQKERICKLCSTKFIPGYCPNCCSPINGGGGGVGLDTSYVDHC